MMEERKSSVESVRRSAYDSGYLSKTPEIDKSSPEYRAVVEKFDRQFGDKLDIRLLEDISKRLDSRFKILADYARETEQPHCDLTLFRAVHFVLKLRNLRLICLIYSRSFVKPGTLLKL
jgi:hypothetical protein